MTEILTGRETNLRMFGTFTLRSGRATASSRSAVRIGPRTFFGLESRAAMEEPSLMESIPTTNGPFASTHFFLLDGLSWWTCVLIDARYANLIKSVVNIAGRYQISHGRLQRFVPHPVLNRSHIEAGTEHAGGIRRTKCLEVELLGV